MWDKHELFTEDSAAVAAAAVAAVIATVVFAGFCWLRRVAPASVVVDLVYLGHACAEWVGTKKKRDLYELPYNNTVI